MDNPLRYQMTEYDCGPTSMLNAVSYLFCRDKIPPEIIRSVMQYCLDCFGPDGACGKCGTSCMAMMFLSNWLSGFGQAGHLAISSQYLSGQDVNFSQNSRLLDALRRKGAAVIRVDFEGWHYVLLRLCGGIWFTFLTPATGQAPLTTRPCKWMKPIRRPITGSYRSAILREPASMPFPLRRNGRPSCCSMRTQS